RRHTRFSRDWSSDVCSSDLTGVGTADCDCRCGGGRVTGDVGPGVCADQVVRGALTVVPGYPAVAGAGADDDPGASSHRQAAEPGGRESVVEGKGAERGARPT